MKDYYHRKNNVGTFLLGALTTIAVGGYLFFGSKKSRRNREKVDWWIEDVKDEVFTKVDKLKDVSREKFDDIVDNAMRKYSRFKNIKEDTIDKIKEDLRQRWEEIREEEDQ